MHCGSYYHRGRLSGATCVSFHYYKNGHYYPCSLKSLLTIIRTNLPGISLILYNQTINKGHRLALTIINAAVNGRLELLLLKDCQRFDAVLTSNLEVLKFRDWWILTYFIFGHGESSLNNFWSMVNLERTCVLLFYYFLCLKANLDLEKTNQLGESSPNFIFAVVNLDLIILEKWWTDGESWPNDFVEKVNRGEDLRWVGSR